MRRMNNRRLLVLSCLAGFLILACSLPGVVITLRNNPTGTVSPSIPIAVPTQIELTPTAQPTAIPTASGAACLIGTWAIPNLSPYVMAAVPPDFAQQYNLQYKGMSGNAYFTFSPDSKITLSAEQLKLMFDASLSILTLPLTVSLDGQATGVYQVEGNNLVAENMDTTGLSASAQVAGQDVIQPNQIIGALPLMQPPTSIAAYTCKGDSLVLKPQAYPDNVPPLIFQRVKQ